MHLDNLMNVAVLVINTLIDRFGWVRMRIIVMYLLPGLDVDDVHTEAAELVPE